MRMMSASQRGWLLNNQICRVACVNPLVSPRLPLAEPSLLEITLGPSICCRSPASAGSAAPSMRLPALPRHQVPTELLVQFALNRDPLQQRAVMKRNSPLSQVGVPVNG